MVSGAAPSLNSKTTEAKDTLVPLTYSASERSSMYSLDTYTLSSSISVTAVGYRPFGAPRKMLAQLPSAKLQATKAARAKNEWAASCPVGNTAVGGSYPGVGQHVITVRAALGVNKQPPSARVFHAA